jgi:hypothetical protein
MLTFPCSPTFLNRNLIRTAITSVLAAISILCGTVPQFFWQYPYLNFNYLAYTQDFSDTQLQNYARAVWQIESHRQQAYNEITRIIGRTPGNIACYQPETLRNLPQKAQIIAVNFCNTSKKIAQNSGLSPEQFNRITRQLQTDAILKRRIQNAIRQIQRQKQ